jgi:glycosyltransferase involved in cell wall biosynthesis
MAAPPKLLLAGRTGPDGAFWKRAQGLGIAEKIEFRANPSAKELARLYQNAQTFASTSEEEGFGVALVEAMASGVPVVSTRSGGPDGIITDAEDGYLVNCGDATAIAERLLFLAMNSDVNIQIGNLARQKVLLKFDERSTAEAYLSMYDELLAAS